MNNEIIKHESDNALSIYEYFSSDERLQDDTMRRDYLSSLDSDDFIDLLQITAGLVRSGEPVYEGFDGHNVALFDHEVPDQQDKESLMRDAWDVAKKFLSNNKLSDRDALDLAALTVAGGVLYAHPYIDGNGRTSRVLSYVIAQGPGSRSTMNKLITSHGDSSGWAITPLGIVENHKPVPGEIQPDRIVWENEEIMGAMTDPLDGLLVDSEYHRDKAIRRFINNHASELSRDIRFSTTKRLNGLTELNANELLDYAMSKPDHALIYGKELMDYVREYRAEYVHRFLAAMQSRKPIPLGGAMPRISLTPPERDPAPTNSKLHTLRKELSKHAVANLVTPAGQALAYHRTYSSLVDTE